LRSKSKPKPECKHHKQPSRKVDLLKMIRPLGEIQDAMIHAPAALERNSNIAMAG